MIRSVLSVPWPSNVSFIVYYDIQMKKAFCLVIQALGAETVGSACMTRLQLGSSVKEQCPLCMVRSVCIRKEWPVCGELLEG